MDNDERSGLLHKLTDYINTLALTILRLLHVEHWATGHISETDDLSPIQDDTMQGIGSPIEYTPNNELETQSNSQPSPVESIIISPRHNGKSAEYDDNSAPADKETHESAKEKVTENSNHTDKPISKNTKSDTRTDSKIPTHNEISPLDIDNHDFIHGEYIVGKDLSQGHYLVTATDGFGNFSVSRENDLIVKQYFEKHRSVVLKQDRDYMSIDIQYNDIVRVEGSLEIHMALK